MNMELPHHIFLKFSNIKGNIKSVGWFSKKKKKKKKNKNKKNNKLINK